MPAALAAVDLIALCECILLLGMLIAVAGMTRAIANALDVSILGHHPFGSLAGVLRNSVLSWVNTAIDDVQATIVDLFHGLTWSFDFMRKGVEALANQVEAALHHAWTVSLRATFSSLYTTLHKAITAVNSRVTELTKTVAQDFTEAKHFATSEAQHAEHGAESYTDLEVRKLHDALVTRIGTLETRIEAELGKDVANIGKHIDAVVRELHAAEQAAEQVIDLPGDVLGELNALAKQFGQAATIGALIAAVPYVTSELANLIEEAGLGKLQCRTNVKGICGTDPSKWFHMLEGLVAVGVGFNLEELVKAGRIVIREAESVVRDFG